MIKASSIETGGGLAILERGRHIVRNRRPALYSIMAPQTVALIGATEKKNSVGRTVLENLKASGFAGAIYPVNPRHESVLGSRCFRRVSDLPYPVDVAIVVTPAPTVPDIIGDCAEASVKGAIIISAGFKEAGAEGAELERRIRSVARGRIRIVGPNCLGVMRPHIGFNATFAAGMARPGNVGFISQSGALCTSILDWSLRENVGFSAFVSIGSMMDVNWGDLIYYLGDDPRTQSIVIYMESIGDARSFLSAAREVALSKPIIVIKVGRTEAAAKAAASHTGSLTGCDEVLDAAFRRVGVLRVNTIAELFDMAEVLAKQPRPRSPRLAIVTNAGGPAALATDMLVSEGGQIASLSDETLAALDELLPSHWSRNNPVDLLGDADPERFARAVDIVAKDPSNDGILVILTPQAMTDATATADRLSRLDRPGGKPILASWMGGEAIRAGEALLNHSRIPTYAYPDTAARAFAYMWRYSANLRSLYETPTLGAGLDHAVKRAKVEDIVRAARKRRCTLFTELESKKILAAYGIPVIETHFAATEEEAVVCGKKLDGPVVLKVCSETITHKTDVGGVKLGLRGERAIRNAFREIHRSVSEHNGGSDFLGVTVEPMMTTQGYELILGSSLDPQFGPVLLFGAGGELVEVFKDHTLNVAPLNTTLARRMIKRTRIAAALKGMRGRPPVDLAALEQLLVRFSQLVVEQRWIKEIDINPLHASPHGFLALDARVILHDATVAKRDLPPLSIRPYPTQYIRRWKLRNGPRLIVRPVRPEDEPLLIEFHKSLSENSVHSRYLGFLNLETSIAHERLSRMCFTDYDREIVLIIDRRNPRNASVHEILGVGQFSKLHGFNEAEWAMIIGDRWQGQGLGTRMLRFLVEVARRENLNRVHARIAPCNAQMCHVARKVGFNLRLDEAANEYDAELVLT